MVSSLSGKVGLPGDGQYAASKFALEGMSESLALEVRRFGIRVTLLAPGPYDTDMLHIDQSSVTEHPSSNHARAYGPLHRALLARERKGEPPQLAARVIAAAIDNPPDNLRIPVGPVAEQVFERLDIDRGERASEVALTATGLRWWTQGKDPE